LLLLLELGLGDKIT